MRAKADIDGIILGVLSGGPRHGYGIAKTIRTESSGLLKLGEGQLYPALHSMEEAGWVSGQWDAEAGDQPKRIYSLTEEGRAELERRKATWREFVDVVGRLMTAAGPIVEVVP